jgi:hypothetical protein
MLFATEISRAKAFITDAVKKLFPGIKKLFNRAILLAGCALP